MVISAISWSSSSSVPPLPLTSSSTTLGSLPTLASGVESTSVPPLADEISAVLVTLPATAVALTCKVIVMVCVVPLATVANGVVKVAVPSLLSVQLVSATVISLGI